MNTTLASLTLMWKGMVAIFVVMIAIYFVICIINPKKGKKKDQ